MNRAIQIAHLTATLAVAVLLSVLAYGAWRCLPWIERAAYNVSLTAYNANKTVEAVNAPCVGFHGSVTCGVVAQASQTVKNVGILAGNATEQVKQSATLVNSASSAIRDSSNAINGTLGVVNGEFASLQKTTDAATTLTAALATDAQTANGTIAAGKPLLEAYTQSGKDLDAILRLPAIPQTIDGLGTTSQNFGKISTDLYYWSHPVLHPEPCKTDKCRWGRVFGDITGYLGVASSGARVYNLFEPIPVTIKH